MSLHEDISKKTFIEIIVGVVLSLPFLILIKVGISGEVLNIFAKIMYTIGVILVTTKMMSFFACFIVKKTSINFFWLLYIFFVVFANFFSILIFDLLSNGYIWLEIIFCIVCSIWLLMDINIVYCEKKINTLNDELEQNIHIHSSEIEIVKNKKNMLIGKKDYLIEQLETYIKRNAFKDPLKNMRYDITFPYIDNYKEKKPCYTGSYTGLGGIIWGRKHIEYFQRCINKYCDYLLQERQSYDEEMKLYEKNIDNLETQIDLIIKSNKDVNILNDLGFDSSGYEMIYENEISNIQKNESEFREINKVHKKINKARRKEK